MEILDPLDRALTNVIRNLIKIDDTTYPNHGDQRQSDLQEPCPSTLSSEPSQLSKKKSIKRMSKDWTTQCSYEFEDDKSFTNHFPPTESDLTCSVENQVPSSVIQFESVFSIGPFPSSNSEHNASNTDNKNRLLPLFRKNFALTTDNKMRSTKNDLHSKIQEKSPIETISTMPKCESSNQSCVKDQQLLTNETSSIQQHLPTSTNSNNICNTKIRSPDEILAARAARLKGLEEQADWLVRKMNATSQRGSVLSNRLEELHETYGSPPGPPPLPDILPTFKLQTQINLESQNVRNTLFLTILDVKLEIIFVLKIKFFLLPEAFQLL